MIPKNIKIKNNELPDEPGVYFYYDKKGRLLYIGKATSLKRRVGSYFNKAHDARIERLVSEIARIDYIVVPTVIEALILEANQIKAHKPPYNIEEKDDKSFVYLVITNETYPRVVLKRGLELEREGVDPWTGVSTVRAKGSITSGRYLHIFGPYTSAKSLRIALDLLRKIIPWSDCQFGGQRSDVGGRKPRPCFNAQIGKCPGVCIEAISSREYKKIIRELAMFFSGKKTQLIRKFKREMDAASKARKFEQAAKLRNRLFALEHIRDIALLTREETALNLVRPDDSYIDLNGRIEAYDISNISGTSAVGSMVVFEHGKPAKDKYRKFKIRMVKGSNDVGMMEEVMRRRLKYAFPPARPVPRPVPRSSFGSEVGSLGEVGGGIKGGGRASKGWELPEVMVIDGGESQVNRVQDVLDELGVSVPMVGLAKGFDRKQDVLVYDKENLELARIATSGKELFQKARDEAHRFAVKYHRNLRAKSFIKK